MDKRVITVNAHANAAYTHGAVQAGEGGCDEKLVCGHF